MHWLLCILHALSGVTVLLAVQACTSPSEGQATNISINFKMWRAADGGITGGRKKLPISLGFKCEYCGGEFGSRAGMDSHRRHRNSIGTPCADPMNSKSMPLTQRGDTYTGTLSLHDTLGVCAYMHFCHYSRPFRQHFATPQSHVIMCIKSNNGNNSVLIAHKVI